MKYEATLRVPGDTVPAGKFLEAADAFLGLHRRMDAAVAGSEKRLEWNLATLRSDRAIIGISPDMAVGAKRDTREMVMSAACGGWQKLEKTAERPTGWDNDALKQAKAIARSFLADHPHVEVGYSVNGERRAIRVTGATPANVDRLLRAYVGASSVEGYIRALSIQGSPKFAIYDKLRGRRIECACDGEVLEQARRNLGRRALVFGTVTSDNQGLAERIRATAIRVFPPDNELATVDEVIAAWDDDRSIDQVMDDIRDGWDG